MPIVLSPTADNPNISSDNIFDIVKPSANSTTAIQVTRADGSTAMLTFDTSIPGIAFASGVRLGFFGATAAARSSAYTQTYATADRTLSAYTSDPESSPYSGINNLQVGSVYATVADLNTLRTAYETLRVFVEDVAQLVNSVIDDGQTYGLFQ